MHRRAEKNAKQQLPMPTKYQDIRWIASALTFSCSFLKELKFCMQKWTGTVHRDTVPMRHLVIINNNNNNPRYQIPCNWSLSSGSTDFLSMNSQATSNSSVAPDSKPWESWKMKLLPSYVIWCSISCMPLWHCEMWTSTLVCTIQLTPIDGIKCVKARSSGLPDRCHSILNSAEILPVWLTILVIYDGDCSPCHTTNFLENSCLACIGPSNDKDTEVGTFVSVPEQCNLFLVCIWYNVSEASAMRCKFWHTWRKFVSSVWHH